MRRKIPEQLARSRFCISEEGRLVWLNGRNAGLEAGFPCGIGYLSVEFGGIRYSAHRVLFLLGHGYCPEVIDHVDGNRQNNVLSNLRESTPAENRQNQRSARTDCQSGLIGALKSRHRWRARIIVDGRRISLGTYDTPEEAHEVYVKAKRELHHGCTI